MRRSAAWSAIAIVAFVAFVVIVVRLAWIGDDACITLRTVENWINGHGLKWNVADRVQTYTHPLWMLLLTVTRLCTGEPYFGTLALGGALSLATTLLLMRLGENMAAATAVVVLLIASKTFTDFTTSGLETPLTFTLLALLARAITKIDAAERRLSTTAVLTGLAMTTRLDLVLIFAPPMLAAMRGMPLSQSARRVAMGMLPLFVWETFATIYYVTPLPITAYAKALNTRLPAGELRTQGLWYVSYVASHDTVTLVTILVGITVGLSRPTLRCRALAIGTFAYCSYVVEVGGDFMAGRFWSPPFVVAVAILARCFAPLPPRRNMVPIVGAGLLLFVPAFVVPFGLPGWMRAPATDEPRPLYHGINDERAFYYPMLGLLSQKRNPPHPGITRHHRCRTAHGSQTREDRGVVVRPSWPLRPRRWRATAPGRPMAV
ncbi:MAG: hypothetical protein ABIP94_14520 [Planctomycetota bacterium]